MTGGSLRWKFGANVGIGVALILAILALAALIAEKHPYRLDMTRKGLHTLSPQTRKIVSSLKEKVHMIAFYFEADEERQTTEGLLESYRALSPKISYEFVDPELHPSIVRNYDVRTAGTMVLEGYGKTQTITLPGEESITSALIRLARTEEKTVYFLTGHGERDIEDSERLGFSQLKEALEKESYRTKQVMLLREPAVPEDAALLIIASPRKELLEQEIQHLDEYVQRGGRVLVLLEPLEDGGLKPWLSRYGVALHRDIVVDTLSRAMGSDYFIPIVETTGAHKIAENTRAGMLFPSARALSHAESVPDTVHIDDLVTTSAGSWGETDTAKIEQGEVKYDKDADIPGPLTVGLIVTLNPKDGAAPEEASPPAGTGDSDAPPGESPPSGPEPQDASPASTEPSRQGAIAVYGNVDFCNNTFLSMLGNRDLILNTVGYLAEDEDTISIRSPKEELQTLALTQRQSRVLFWVSIVLAPGIVLLCGVCVYRVRRRSR